MGNAFFKNPRVYYQTYTCKESIFKHTTSLYRVESCLNLNKRRIGAYGCCEPYYCATIIFVYMVSPRIIALYKPVFIRCNMHPSEKIGHTNMPHMVVDKNNLLRWQSVLKSCKLVQEVMVFLRRGTISQRSTILWKTCFVNNHCSY